MTVASEIQRLQGAKASARASIINKGVNVPASAKVDDYHTYIDRIQQGSSVSKFTDAVVLRAIPSVPSPNLNNQLMFGHKMTYVDDDVMILGQAFYYSQSGDGQQFILLNGFALDGTIGDFNTGLSSATYTASRSITYRMYECERAGNNISFIINYRVIGAGETHYYNQGLIYNTETNTWSDFINEVNEGWTLPDTGDMDLYTPSFEYVGSGSYAQIKWTPVSS